MPWRLSSCSSPIPLNISSFGVFTAPVDRMTSRLAFTVNRLPSRVSSTPVTSLPLKVRRSIWVLTSKVTFFWPSTGYR